MWEFLGIKEGNFILDKTKIEKFQEGDFGFGKRKKNIFKLRQVIKVFDVK